MEPNGGAPVRDQEGWFTRERVLTFILGLATLLGLYVCYLIVKPFIAPIAFALALCVATNGPFRWLRGHIRNRSLAAAAAVVAVALLIIVPLGVLVAYLLQQAAEGIQQAGQFPNWRGAIERQPQLAELLHWAESRLNLQDQLGRLANAIAGNAAGLLRSSVQAITQLVIMLFVLFFLYRDEDQARGMLWSLAPLSREEANRLFARVGNTIHATVNGSLTVALVQAVLAGSMYWALGVPVPALWGAATFIAALVPVFGTVLIWGPITLYLALSGTIVKALVLAGWGMLAVGTIDNFLYPFLVGTRMRLHTVPIFFAIIGGINLFGVAGLILGPLALAITMGLLDVWWERTAFGQAAEEAVSETAETPRPPGAAVRTEPGA